MFTVYRVEHPESGLGPYHHESSDWDYMDYESLREHSYNLKKVAYSKHANKV